MDIKKNDKFILHSSDGTDYRMEVVNINECREPSAKYGLDVYNADGVYAGDVMFFGDNFFEKNRDKLERVE